MSQANLRTRLMMVIAAITYMAKLSDGSQSHSLVHPSTSARLLAAHSESTAVRSTAAATP